MGKGVSSSFESKTSSLCMYTCWTSTSLIVFFPASILKSFTRPFQADLNAFLLVLCLRLFGCIRTHDPLVICISIHLLSLLMELGMRIEKTLVLGLLVLTVDSSVLHTREVLNRVVVAIVYTVEVLSKTMRSCIW